MGSNFKMLKNWYSLAKPNKFWFGFQFFTVLLKYVFLLISPIFAANVITCLTAGDFSGAMINLTWEIVMILASAVSFAINYYCMKKLINPIYLGLQHKIANTVINASNKNFKKVGREKLINIIGNDSYNIAAFADTLSGRLARFVRVVITIITIMCINWIVGLVAIALNVIDYFVVNMIYERKSKVTKRMKEGNDHLFQNFAEIMDSKDTINNLDLKDKVLYDFDTLTKSYTGLKHKNNVYDSKIENTYFGFYKIIIYFISLFMIYLTSNGALTPNNYIVLASYLLSCVQIANESFTILNSLKETNICTNRVKAVLNFTETKKIPVGENEEDFINGVISFDNVSYKGNSSTPKLKNFSAHFRENQTTLILGEPTSGKRTVFKLLDRQFKPKTGNITLSGTDIYDFSDKAYKTNFNYVTTKPFIFKGTIMRNLKMIENSNKKIFEITKMLGLHEQVLALPHQYNTDAEKLSLGQKYLLALARALLTNCEVLAIYEFPSNLTKQDMEYVKTTLNTINGQRTILIFSALESCCDIADKIIKIENGQVSGIYFNQKKSS